MVRSYLATGVMLCCAGAVLVGQQLPADQVAEKLRGGGHVLVMRHASSPREAPSRELANPDNVTRERQLDEAGRRGATEMGTALRALRIPIGAVLSSATPEWPSRALSSCAQCRSVRPCSSRTSTNCAVVARTSCKHTTVDAPERSCSPIQATPPLRAAARIPLTLTEVTPSGAI